MKAILLALAVLAVPPEVDIPPEVRPSGQYVKLIPKTDAKSITYVGLSGIDPLPAEMLKDPRMFLLDVRGLPVARYKFAAVACLADEQTRFDFEVVIGTPPVVVTPPGPGPLNPPPPSPGTPLAGMRVLILEETGPSKRLTNQQAETLNSLEIRAYLDAKTNKQWRRYDPDLSLDKLPKDLQDLRAKATPTTLPWVVIGDLSAAGEVSVAEQGPYGAEGKDKALALLKKWGG
jgi:hypothetical protein